MNPVHLIPDHFSSACFIASEGAVLSYGEAREAVSSARDHLTANGVPRRGVVALHTNRDAASIITLMALLELECSVLLTHSRWPTSMLTEAVQRVNAGHAITVSSLTEISVRSVLPSPSTPKWASGPGVIVATSGSTGIPKLALLSLKSLLASAESCAPACHLAPQDQWHLSLPLFHVGGLGILFRTLVTGSSLSLESSLEGCACSSITHLSLVPTQLYRLLKDPATRELLGRQKAIMLGGAPIGSRIIAEALKLGVSVMLTYGLTEMGSAVTLGTSRPLPGEQEVPLGTPLPNREISLSPDGEVLVRGETLFSGYITEAGLSLPLSEDGWFATGDIGRLLPDGTLVIIGRRDAQFISGGENIHPEMIESALTSLPGIIAACVVPVANEEFGHRPFAFIVSEREALNLNEIREALRPLIPGFALPIGIREAPAELVTPTGKISRAAAMMLR